MMLSGGMMKTSVVIHGERFEIGRDDVVAAAQRETPRRVNAYFVDIDGRRFPPKQLIRAATGSDAPFVTAVAVRALRDLGFEVVGTEQNTTGV